MTYGSLPKVKEMTSKELQIKAINQDPFYKENFLPFNSPHELLTLSCLRDVDVP